MTNKLISEFIKNKDPRITENSEGRPLWNQEPWPKSSNIYLYNQTDNFIPNDMIYFNAKIYSCLKDNGPGSINGIKIPTIEEYWKEYNNDYYTKSETNSSLNLKANLISPSLAGMPTAPTADVNNITDQLATTQFVSQFNDSLFGTKIRNKYYSTVTVYVRTDGNDSNDGLTNTTSGALKTLTGALHWLRRADLSGYRAYVILNPGTYDGTWWDGFGINCATTIQSADITNPAVISTAVTIADYANVEYKNLVFQNTLTVDLSAIVFASNCNFNYQGAETGNIILVQRNSYLYLQSGCSISGTAANGIYVTQISMVNNWGDLTFNDPVFSGSVIAATRLGLVWTGATLNGNATGRRFYVNLLSLIDSNNRGPNAIPGTIDGAVDSATGGYYR